MYTDIVSVEIIHECNEYLVVFKPAGLLVHSDGRSTEYTLAQWLLDGEKVQADIGEPWADMRGNSIPRPGIVHRLDKDTSGVLVIAKTQSMYEWLKAQFKQRTVAKTYEAVVHGVIQEEGGYVDRPIGRSGSDFRKKSAQRGALGRAREAYTEYTVLRRFDGGSSGAGFTHVQLRPKTGRTHQLRVHMKVIRHPIVADVLYGGLQGIRDTQGVTVGNATVSALALRAVKLGFSLPDGSWVEFCCKGFIL